MKRYVVISFRGPEAHRWQSFDTIELAQAAEVGINLADVDSISGSTYDLEEGALVIHPDDFYEEYHGPRCVSAERAMAPLRAAYRQEEKS